MRQGITISPCVASTSYHRQPALAFSSNRSWSAVRPRLVVSSRGNTLLIRAALERQQGSGHGKPEILCQSDLSSEHPADHARRRTAWNKGKSMPESARLKISDAQKKRWQDPEVRASITASMKGKPAWNKGMTVSEETREKMRLAKLNRPLSRATRLKMSAARRGKSLSPEAAATVSAKLTGRPKSPEHKAAIAATQRRRHAAVRVLKAVEAVYEASPDNGTGGAGRGNPAVRKERSQALNAYKAELREYRSLQEELSPWTKAFLERHGRKPTTLDVQNTGIDWLISRYKQYIFLRERIFNETTVLRSRLDGAGVSSGYGNATGTEHASNSLPATGPTNANGPTAGARASVANRVATAMQYKVNKAAAASAAATVAAQPVQPGSKVVNSNGVEQGNVARVAPVQAVQPLQIGQTPPRVRAAMQAAMDYRLRKAEATKAKAEAAAVSAKSGWTEGRKSALNNAASAPKMNNKVVINGNHGAMTTAGSVRTQEPAAAAAAAGPSCVVPADIVRAQAVAHRAMKEVKQAEAEVRRALRLDSSSSFSDDDDLTTPSVHVAGAGV